MAFKGRKVADVYVELNLDKDELRRGMAAAGSEMGADADRVGKQLGDRMTSGIAQKVEALSAKVVKSRQAESKAADDVKLAELRLSEARDKGGQKASTLLALEQKLSQAQLKLADSSRAAAVATRQHEDAQRRLGQAMADDIENLGKKIGPSAEKAGKDAGDKLTVGMRGSISGGSPLIAAAVAGALIAGAPAMLTAATGLFAGIGVLAAFQSDKVKSAWLGTWQQVKEETVQSASVIEPTLLRVAGNVGAAFERMRPQVTAAFSAAAPQVEVFARGVTSLAENALPGLVRAVQAGMPVTQGLADFLARTGTGLSDFFDRITAHAPAAGQVWAQLGSTMGTLLPMLGELVGQGAELGARVLPLLNGTLGVTLQVLTALGPALPAVAAGFGAFRVVGMLSGPLESFAGALGGLASKEIPFLSRAASGAQSVLTGLGAALPVVAVAAGVLGGLFEASSKQTDDWANSLIRGGKASAEATAEMQRQKTAGFGLSDIWERMKGLTNDGIAQLEGYSGAQDKAAHKAQELLAAMDPLSRAQALQKQALNDLNFALEKHGAGSASAEYAERQYKDASDKVAAAQAAEERAISGVTKAMMAQADEALAAIDSGIALRVAQTNATQAEKDYQAALATGKAHLNDASQASTDYETALSRVVAAAGKAAADTSGLTDKTDLWKVSTAAQLKTLYDLRGELGSSFPASLQAAITKLEGMGVTTDAASGKLDTLGAKNPQPTIGPAADKVTPQVDNLMNSLFNLGAAHPVPQADLNIDPAARNKDVMIGMLAHLGAQTPTPVAGLDPGSLPGTTNNLLGQMWNLGAQRPTPVAGAVDQASGILGNIKNAIDALYNRTVYVTTVHQDIGVTGRGTAGQAAGGNVGEAVQRAARGFASGGAPYRRADGMIFGPGGPFDDMVPAVTTSGEPLRVSPSEWIVNAIASARQGAARMAALNAGTADIVMRRPGLPRSAGSLPNPATGTGASNGGTTITVGELNVTFAGAGLTGDQQSMRRAAVILREELIKLERETA